MVLVGSVANVTVSRFPAGDETGLVMLETVFDTEEFLTLDEERFRFAHTPDQARALARLLVAAADRAEGVLPTNDPAS
jgi:hypothetical protein